MEFAQVMSLLSDNSWRSRVNSGKGSFRGVPFFIMDDATISGGRRLVRHEYPMRDDGEIEDMGRSTRDYAFTAIVFGEDYLSQKEALIAALEVSETGEIDHPYYGKKRIHIESYTVRESCQTGGVALFSVTFVLAAENTAPVISSVPTLNAKGLTDSTLAEVTEVWSSLTQMTQYAIERMDTLENTVSAVVNGIRGLPAGAGMNQLLGSALALQGALTHLSHSPSALFGSISDLISGMVDVAPASAANRALRKTANALETQFIANVPSVADFQQVVNTTTTIFLTRELAALTLNAARDSARAQALVPELTSVSSTQDRLAGLVIDASREIPEPPLIETVEDVKQSGHDFDVSLTDLIIRTGDLGWFNTSQQLRDFRLFFLQQMQTTATQLPTARTVSVFNTEPALVTLYRETQSVAQIDRFTRRNGIRHPAFVTGALSVEVIDG